MNVTFLPSNMAGRAISPSAPVSKSSTMTPFREIPVDGSWAAQMRARLEKEPLEYFRANFGGRIPLPEEKQAFIDETERQIRPLRTWVNDTYVVHSAHTPPFTPNFTHLVVRRHDGQPCGLWAHFQQIKNELVGRECEALELFPAESRLVDTANEYHIWVHSDPAFRFGIGWTRRVVVTERLGDAAQHVEFSRLADSTAATLTATDAHVAKSA